MLLNINYSVIQTTTEKKTEITRIWGIVWNWIYCLFVSWSSWLWMPLPAGAMEMGVKLCTSDFPEVWWSDDWKLEQSQYCCPIPIGLKGHVVAAEMTRDSNVKVNLMKTHRRISFWDSCVSNEVWISTDAFLIAHGIGLIFLPLTHRTISQMLLLKYKQIRSTPPCEQHVKVKVHHPPRTPEASRRNPTN